MKTLTILSMCLFILSIDGQAEDWKELTPILGKTIHLSPEGEQAFLEAQKTEEYPEDKENYWDVLPVGCSFYCASELGIQSASSALKAQGKATYNAENAHDLSLQTAWIEGAPEYGIGESLTYQMPPENPRITDIIIINGYVKSDKAWRENSRVKQLKLYLNGKPYALLNLADCKQEQHFKVEPIGYGYRRKDTEWLKKQPPTILTFEITEVYPGEKYKDTAITEIYFDGIDHH